VFHLLASLKLAVVLMVALAMVLCAATVIETRHGMAYAHWYVYKSAWFSVLLALMGVNIFSAAAVRFPWKRHQTGFVVTHGGLLVLMAGSMYSFLSAVEGQLSLAEGETISTLRLPDRSQITALWQGRPGEAPYEFTFAGGPVDWPASRVLDLGEVDGVSARVLRYFSHARPVINWVDDAQNGGPLLTFRVTGPDGKVVAAHELVDQQAGDALFVGPIRLQLQRAAYDSMVDDFLHPSGELAADDGLLVAHYQDAVVRVPVRNNVGKRFPFGAGGAEVEIVEYFPNARPDRMGRFTSKGDEPVNPLLELRVHLPAQQEPLRQIASAKEPLLNLDSVYRRECPVKVRYYHPAIQATAIEFLQTSDGTLYGRTIRQGKISSLGVVSVPGAVALDHNFQIDLIEQRPRVRSRLSFESAPRSAAENELAEPAALVEISSEGQTREAWLQRHDLHYGTQEVALPGGQMLLRFEAAHVPLAFSLKLEKFRREMNPGRQGDAAFVSAVRLIDREHNLDEAREISMNQPLTHRQFTFYQSGFDENGHGQAVSVLNVAYDPGRPLKYAGSLMICLGIALMFYMRAYFFRKAGDDHDAGRSSIPRRPSASHIWSRAGLRKVPRSHFVEGP
jgi:hypothetical protein